MKVLLSTGSPSWGGLEIYTARIAHSLVRKGVELDLLCYKGSKIEEYCKNNNIPVLEFPVNQLKAIRKINKYFNNNYDIIHTRITHDLWSIVPALNLSKNKEPLILTINMETGFDKKDIFHRYLYRRVNKVFTVSDYLRKNVLKHYPFSEQIVEVMHDGYMPDLFDKSAYDKEKIRKEFGLEKADIIIGHIGRISEGKGHPELVNAAAILSERFKELNIHYIIVGEAEESEMDYKKEVLDLINENGLKDKFLIAGFQKDVAKYMAVFDVLAFPSHNEAFGDTVVEAMAMNLPVVTCRNGGVQEIVVEDVTGLYVEPKNYQQLTEALSVLIKDKDKRLMLGNAGRERAEKYFNIEKITEKLINHYEKLKQNKRRAADVQIK
jgi:glycosyltransferase involved in cell wall biosynthesis